ncbi:Intracellular sulfur oxidation protein DsrF [Candidatus Mikella endobia]|uniref:Intracellular sulfur oxidation protein DsrF n=1 Tax=Candidatus Mikella endobia TaxID=1778264 RepID=A0A143WQ74_9ENTR|nr:sulfurtransferase complex subunit TusC [Candidatus Mikella endobia]CUX95771.1 Intracellular sulfur oxidation protein DsrF [Candidatus Mikella endobia]
MNNNNIAFIFSHGPYGNESSREGLDLLLATSVYSNNIGVFFISDGVFLLLLQQQPSKILSKNFIPAFGILSIYDINQIYICAHSAQERGINNNIELILESKWLMPKYWYQYLAKYNIILKF